MNKKLTVCVSSAVARRILRQDRELTIVLSYGGPEALPNCYRWRTPTRPCWARIECPQLVIDETRETTTEVPKRAYGRLGRAFRGYAAALTHADELVHAYFRCGRNDPRTQEEACFVVLPILRERFTKTKLGQLAAVPCQPNPAPAKAVA